MRRMLDKMGLDMTTLENVEEVIIKTDKKELYLVKPQVIEMKGKDSTIFQVIASDIEEKQRDVPSFKEEDLILVYKQATCQGKSCACPDGEQGESRRPFLALQHSLVLPSLLAKLNLLAST